MTLDELRNRLDEKHHAVSVRDDVDAAAAAYLLGVTTGTLANWRSKRIGPPWMRLGGVRYPLIGLMRWLDERTHRAA